MVDRSDHDFAGALDRYILITLNGDGNTPGLYQTLVSSQSWDQFNKASGHIQALEQIRQEMRNIARKMNGDDQNARNQVDRELN